MLPGVVQEYRERVGWWVEPLVLRRTTINSWAESRLKIGGLRKLVAGMGGDKRRALGGIASLVGSASLQSTPFASVFSSLCIAFPLARGCDSTDWIELRVLNQRTAAVNV